MANAPVSATVRAYQVGFGDAFLLSFRYAAGKEKHVLVDFGTTKLPPGAPKDHMQQVADDVEKRCAGKLTAVVATHRHQDHVSGFATSGVAPGKTISALDPEVVLQPWTEDPDLAPDAGGPKVAPAFAARRGFTAMLASLESVAAAAVAASGHAKARGFAAELRFLGEDNLSNLSAVKNLMSMGKKRRYLSFGMKSGLEALLPGVTVTVLGPPTIDQYPEVEAKRAKDAQEYWQLARRTLKSAQDGEAPLFPGARRVPLPLLPLEDRWFVPRVRDGEAETLLELVRRMDDYLNNTSLILLFEVGKTALLFPGDAQIENWEYLLEHAPEKKRTDLLKRLANVKLYKVGHHGSLNATPKTVWDLFAARGGAGDPNRLKSVMSTLPGKHGSETSGTEVPRKKLVAALSKETDLTRTDRFPASALFEDVTIDL